MDSPMNLASFPVLGKAGNGGEFEVVVPDKTLESGYPRQPAESKSVPDKGPVVVAVHVTRRALRGSDPNGEACPFPAPSPVPWL